MQRFATAFFVLTLASACTRSSVPPIYACPALAVAGPPLIYPVPEASGVPVAAGDLVFAGRPFGADVGARLVASPVTSATPVPLGPFTTPPSPLPMPTSSGFAGATLYGAYHPQLASHTTYSVNYFVTSATRCPLVPTSSGSFTTQ